MSSRYFSFTGITLALAGIATAPLQAQSARAPVGWAPAFQDLGFVETSGPFLTPIPSGKSFATIEAGPLEGLYFSGEFGDPLVPENRILRFTENASQVIGAGFAGALIDLCAFDDGSGPALYAAFLGGPFYPDSPGLRRWDGSSWEDVALPSQHESVFALTTWNDGSGEKLIAGLGTPDGTDFAGVAAYDGQTWSKLGPGLSGTVEALAVYDPGSGPLLVAGGVFTEFGSPPYTLNNVAAFDGFTWQPLAEGASSSVRELQFHLEDGVPTLYASGIHFDPKTNESQRLRSWNGSQWRAIPGVTYEALALASVEPGGPLEAGLYASLGQDFSTATELCFGLGRWDGVQWHPVGTGLPGSLVRDLHVHGTGAETSLFAAFSAGGADSGDRGFARWGQGAQPRYVSLPGCVGDKPGLLPQKGSLDLGTSNTLQMFGDIGGAASLWYYYLGVDGSDAFGCGLELAGAGEVLLDLQQPVVLFATAPGNPQVIPSPVLNFSIPADPELAGLELAVQALGLLVNGAPPKLSRSLVATLQFAP